MGSAFCTHGSLWGAAEAEISEQAIISPEKWLYSRNVAAQLYHFIFLEVTHGFLCEVHWNNMDKGSISEAWILHR